MRPVLAAGANSAFAVVILGGMVISTILGLGTIFHGQTIERYLPSPHRVFCAAFSGEGFAAKKKRAGFPACLDVSPWQPLLRSDLRGVRYARIVHAIFADVTPSLRHAAGHVR